MPVGKPEKRNIQPVNVPNPNDICWRVVCLFWTASSHMHASVALLPEDHIFGFNRADAVRRPSGYNTSRRIRNLYPLTVGRVAINTLSEPEQTCADRKRSLEPNNIAQ